MKKTYGKLMKNLFWQNVGRLYRQNDGRLTI